MSNQPPMAPQLKDANDREPRETVAATAPDVGHAPATSAGQHVFEQPQKIAAQNPLYL